MGALRPQGLQKFVPAGADYSHPLAWRARCMGQQQGCEGGGRRDLPKSRSELSVESGAGVGGLRSELVFEVTYIARPPGSALCWLSDDALLIGGDQARPRALQRQKSRF